MIADQVDDRMRGAAPHSASLMPALFVGHGSPMNAIEVNEFSRAWRQVGAALPRPRAILCISAHWETEGTYVTAMERPRTIHDFGGFPRELYEARYPAPGGPDVARLVQETVRSAPVRPDLSWGLDHGAWSVLYHLFPGADVPVLQLSLDSTQPPAHHYSLGRALRTLRTQGILILGSGNIVHNLRMIAWQGGTYAWATEFDETVRQLIETGDHGALARYQELGQAARLSIPTNEHFLPLLYVLAAQEHETVRFFAEKVTLGSISMRSLQIG